MSSLQIEAQLAEIDAEITTLEARLLKLRQRRNALMPLSSLPPEIIGKILSIVVSDTVKEFKGSEYTKTPFYCWIKVTHFCSQWRQIALGDPELWTFLDTASSLGWFKAFLERSKGHLLDVDTRSFPIKDTVLDEIFRLVAANMHRIRSLHLRPVRFRQRLYMLQNIPAPELETLQYSLGNVYLEPGPDVQVPGPKIMPKLRYLKISATPSPQCWEHFLPSSIPSLTDVTVSEVHTSDLLELLKRCPGVKRLQIEGTDSWREPEQPTEINLPELEFLVSPSTVPWPVLSRLSCPSLRHVTLDTPAPEAPQIEQIFSVLSKLLEPTRDLGRAEDAWLHRISLSWIGDLVRIQALSSTGKVIAGLSISVRWQSTYGHLLKTVHEFARRMDVAVSQVYLKARGFEVIGDLGYQPLISAFGQDVQVGSIHLRETNTFVGFFSLLLEELGDEACTTGVKKGCGCGQCRDARVRAFPGLERILVYDVKVDEEWLGKKSRKRVLDSVMDWLRERQGRGMGLEELKFLHSEVDQGVIDGLTPVVNSVTVAANE